MRFEGIDTDFKELAYDAHKTPNVVEATNKPGLYNRLEDIQSRFIACFMSFFLSFLFFHSFTAVQYGSECSVAIHIMYNPQAVFQSSIKVQATNTSYRYGASSYRLALCEKALAEYLDTKRLAFPRFYFISSADLLDILSNGTNPQQVTHTHPALYKGVSCSLISAWVFKLDFACSTWHHTLDGSVDHCSYPWWTRRHIRYHCDI